MGFVGDYNHCLSFYERWLGFQMAMHKCGLSIDRDTCIIYEENKRYHDHSWMITQVKQIYPLPEMFVCANDGLAAILVAALRELGISVPSDVMVTGFDNTLSILMEPTMTTVDAHSEKMGITAAQLLLSRVQTPNLPYMRVHLQTDIIYRNSTHRK